MALPDVTETIRDGALGITGLSNNAQVKIGTCSAGTANILYAFSSIQDAINTLGVGPLTEAVAHSLSVAGGPVYAMKISGSVAGSAGAPSKTGTGTATLAVTGTPVDGFSLVAQIVTGAGTVAAGTATVQISLDGGNTFGPVTTIPTGGVIALNDPQGRSTGLTLTWTYVSGTAFVVADQWTVACTAPGFSVSDANTTLTALLALPNDFSILHVIGEAASVAGCASLAAAIDTQLQTAETNYRFMFGLVECPADTDPNIASAFVSFSSKRVGVCVGRVTLVSPVSGRLASRNCAFSATSRAQKVDPSISIARVADGPLEGVRAISRDEYVSPLLDAARFITTRSIIGRTGFYLTRDRLMAPVGSDYGSITRRRVMDIACKVMRNAFLDYLNSSVRVNANGTIAERDASVIESQTGSKLEQALTVPGFASAVSVAVDRTNNLVSTQTLKGTIRVTPLGLAETIALDLGFTNPNLAVS